MTRDITKLQNKEKELTTYEVIQEIAKIFPELNFVSLPCKIGDILYELDNDEIYTLKVRRIDITEDCVDVYANEYDDEYEEEYDDEHIFSIDDFNVKIFTNRELAIKALNADEESDD